MSHLIELKNITKKYIMGNTEVTAVDDVSVAIDAGEFVAIMGASGSGKSTMMNILGFLDLPTSGTYSIMGRDVTGLEEDELSILRNHIAGLIFILWRNISPLSITTATAIMLASTITEKIALSPSVSKFSI